MLRLRRFWAVGSLCVACGTSGGSTAENTSAAPEYAGAILLAQRTQLPACNEGHRGDVYYVREEDSFYYCDGSKNRELDLGGRDGKDGVSWLVQLATASPAECAAGGSVVQVGPDANRDGVLDGVASSVAICNGVAGRDGSDGVDGKPGLPGAPGEDGTDGAPGLTSLVNLESFSSSTGCPQGGIRIESGVDLDRSGVLDTAEVSDVEELCREQPNDSDGASAMAGAGGTAGDGGAGGSGDTASDGPEAFQLTATLPEIRPGFEAVSCVTLELGNLNPAHIGGLELTSSAGVFAVVVSAVSGGADPTPKGCPAYGSLSDTDARPLTLTRSHDHHLELPSGVGYSITRHQALRFEIHAFNATDYLQPVEVNARLLPVSEGFAFEAGLVVLSDMDVRLFPGGPRTMTGGMQVRDLVGEAKIAAVQAYSHGLGEHAAIDLQGYGRIYDQDMSQGIAPLQRFDPALEPPGGVVAVAFTYSPVTNLVTFGVDAGHEPFMTLVYHYPAVAHHLCQASANGYSVCAP